LAATKSFFETSAYRRSFSLMDIGRAAASLDRTIVYVDVVRV
jgi:hypothetical protein